MKILDPVFYVGAWWQVVEKDDGKIHIGPPGDLAASLTIQGADMRLLSDIGDQDPEEVIEKLFESIPKE